MLSLQTSCNYEAAKGKITLSLDVNKRRGKSVNEYFQQFTKANLKDENMVVGAFTWGLLLGELSMKFLGRPP